MAQGFLQAGLSRNPSEGRPCEATSRATHRGRWRPCGAAGDRGRTAAVRHHRPCAGAVPRELRVALHARGRRPGGQRLPTVAPGLLTRRAGASPLSPPDPTPHRIDVCVRKPDAPMRRVLLSVSCHTTLPVYSLPLSLPRLTRRATPGRTSRPSSTRCSRSRGSTISTRPSPWWCRWSTSR